MFEDEKVRGGVSLHMREVQTKPWISELLEIFNSRNVIKPKNLEIGNYNLQLYS